MEQKMIEKVNKAIDMYNAKATKFNENTMRFLKEMFPDDICKMAKEFCKNDKKIEFSFNDEMPYSIRDYDVRPFSGRLYVKLMEKKDNYPDSIFESINIHIYNYEQSVHTLESIQSHAEEIISKITGMYETKINKQNDELDKIFQRLSSDEPEIKHIKVTVEWN